MKATLTEIAAYVLVAGLAMWLICAWSNERSKDGSYDRWLTELTERGY